jgi:MSHA biogenesis protein MshG
MPIFLFKARDKLGKLHEGELEAANRDAIASRLIDDRMTPVSIVPMEAAPRLDLNIDLSRFFPEPKITLDDMVLFCRQMHALTRSGIPIMRAVFGLAETSKNPVMETILKDVGLSLGRGNTLSQSLKKFENQFTPLFISMVQVGESTGKLDDAFSQLVRHLEMERDTRKKITTAMRYPTMVMISVFTAIMVVNIFVIPSFSKVFSKFGADLPLATTILLNTSEFFLAYWWLIMGVLVVSIAGALKYIKTEQGEYNWHKIKLRLPLIGDLLNRISLSRFTRTFAMLFSAGVPILQALEVSAEAIDNRYIEAAVKEMRAGIERGDSLARTANASGMFTPLILQMIAVGEESGAVDKLLEDVSDFYDQETEYDVANLSAAIEPIMLVFMGGLVLVLALGIFLPMWDLGTVAR